MPADVSVKKAASSLREVQDTLARISSNKGVMGVMILNSKGDILQSTWDSEHQLHHAATVSGIVRQAGSLLLQGEEDPLSFITIRSKQREILVAPDGDFLLVVLQNPLLHNSERNNNRPYP
jgi:dynein light chain roadblock-type